MPRTRKVSAALASAAVALGAAAQADAATSTTYYFKCVGPSKVQNGTSAAWSKTKPTTSFTANAGCGFLDAPGPMQTAPEGPTDAAFAGVHAGPIAKATVELHNLVLSRLRPPGAAFPFTIRLTAGGKLVRAATISVPPVLSSTGLTEKFTFTLSRLGIPRGGLTRRVVLSVHTADRPSAWVFDAAEVPAGITFVSP